MILLTIAVFIGGTGVGLGATWAFSHLQTSNATADSTSTTQTKNPTQSILPEPQKILTLDQFKTLETDADAVMGDPNAPITIIEFSDFQCTYCKKFFDDTFALLKTTYIDTGKVRLVYKNFPLVKKHPQALAAGEALECTNILNPSKTWEIHDALFTNSTEWNGNESATDVFTSYAEKIGLDKDQFTSCMQDPNTEKAVMDDFTAGQKVGVKATPSFIITTTTAQDAKLYKGALSFVKLQAIIAGLLN